MHVFVDTDISQGREVPFTFVLRGAEGGVIDGLSHVISTSERGARVILRLRILKLATTGCDDLLIRFARDILRDTTQNILIAQCKRGRRLVTRVPVDMAYDAHRTRPLTPEAHGMEDAVVVSKPARWRDGKETTSARLIRSSVSGRRLLVRLQGPVPSAWATVRIELDIGCMGEPRPIQLIAMVIGTLPIDDPGACHVLVRLLRWSEEMDRMLWLRWLRHQQRLDTSVMTHGGVEVTRTIAPLYYSAPST